MPHHGVFLCQYIPAERESSAGTDEWRLESSIAVMRGSFDFFTSSVYKIGRHMLFYS
jgi:hypothetical protein